MAAEDGTAVCCPVKLMRVTHVRVHEHDLLGASAQQLTAHFGPLERTARQIGPEQQACLRHNFRNMTGHLRFRVEIGHLWRRIAHGVARHHNGVDRGVGANLDAGVTMRHQIFAIHPHRANGGRADRLGDDDAADLSGVGGAPNEPVRGKVQPVTDLARNENPSCA